MALYAAAVINFVCFGSFLLRDSLKVGKNSIPSKEVIGITTSGESCNLAELAKTGWSLIDGQWLLDSQQNPSADSHLFKLVGNRLVCMASLLQ